MHDKGKSIHVEEGVRLYQQTRSPYWWANIRIIDPSDALRQAKLQTRVSTKIKVSQDKSGAKASLEAVKLAAAFSALAEQGLATKGQATFEKVAQKAVERVKKRNPGKSVYRDYISTIETYLIPYFGKTKMVKVDRSAMFKFFEWREQETDGQISLTRKRVTNKAFREIFDVACELGYLQEWQVPSLPKVEHKRPERREHFPQEEVDLILKGFRGFIDAARNEKSRQIRQLLECYVNFLIGAGARPGNEVLSIRFGDIKRQKQGGRWLWVVKITKGKLAEKTGPRPVILGDVALDALKAVLKLRDAYKKVSLDKAIEQYPNDLVFLADYREDPPDLGRSFKQYLDYLEISGPGRVLYSLRHSYISHHLLNKSLTVRAIAKQCGTSEEMINRHYDHIESFDYADELIRSDGFRQLSANHLEAFMTEGD